MELDKKVFTVKEVSNLISNVFSHEVFQNLTIKGEINSKSVKGGNTYLNLIEVEEGRTVASLAVNVFRYASYSIKTNYEVGDEVLVTGDLSYYPPFGKLSLNARELELAGEGLELIRLQKLKEKLEKEGLFSLERKRKLPKHISKIGIITSKSGAAYQDILNTLKRKIPVSTVLFDAVVQGNDAPASLIRALDKANKSDVDVIIFGRGGGSKTDLSCFNNEELVRKIAASKKVIITGIGHEIDTSLCDLAADIYAITPTQAANLVLPDLNDVLTNINNLKNKLYREVSNYINNKIYLLDYLNSALEKNSLTNRLNTYLSDFRTYEFKLNSYYLNYLNNKSQMLEKKQNQLEQVFLNFISNKQNELKNYELSLEKANPFNSLKEGYALIKKQGKYVSSVSKLLKNDEIEIGFKDGISLAKIIGEEK